MRAVPSATWRTLDERMISKPLPQGLDALWDAGVGVATRLVPQQKRYLQKAEKVLALEKQFSAMGNGKLQQAIGQLRETFRRGRDTEEELHRAFAAIREVATRQIGERPFPVQVAGAPALSSGCVAEMATGEGKTLTATLPATIAGWRGRGCHVITVNDYLAKRDAEWMEGVYGFCGLKVAHIEGDMPPAQRQEAYAADVTYCTNKEVTADFLRDRLVLGRCGGLSAALLERLAGGQKPVLDRLVQRGLDYAIVDEADSVLIDEAVTPLIISGPAPNVEQTEAFQQAAEATARLEPNSDYRINAKYREIELTDSGRRRLAELTEGWGGLWRATRRCEELAVRALTAKELYQRGQQYVVEQDKVIIVDDFTGRLMHDRQWRDGLHQAVEAKERVEVTPPKETYARLSFQRFFRMYRRLAGMTGTAQEAAAEFWQIYHLRVVVIPTNRPCIRRKPPDVVFTTAAAKWNRIVTEIEAVHATGRPILIGTRSVRNSEHVSGLLRARGLECQVLNAVHHQEEAMIVAGAGQAGRITVATNMAGRGTDVKLGPGVADLGGLFVLATERNESGRIDRQLFGRCARQGDPGTAQAITSLEDEFVSRHAKGLVAYLKKHHGQTEEDIAGRGTRAASRLAHLRAERLALRRRRAVMRADHWLDEHLSFAGRE